MDKELREKIAKIIGECGDEWYLTETASPERIADQILFLIKEAGYRKIEPIIKKRAEFKTAYCDELDY